MTHNQTKIRFENTNSAGRSMVEMLGTLAIIGVLSIGGITGYRFAMDKYKANQTINDINLRVRTIETQLARGIDISLSEFSTTSTVGYAFSAPEIEIDDVTEEQLVKLSVNGLEKSVCQIVKSNVFVYEVVVNDDNEENTDCTDIENGNKLTILLQGENDTEPEDETEPEPQCVTHNDCADVEGKPKCGSDGKCEACPEGQLWGSDHCIECMNDEQCVTAEAPHCNMESNKCVQCLTHTDCSEGTPKCGTSGLCEACPEGSVWNESRGLCQCSAGSKLSADGQACEAVMCQSEMESAGYIVGTDFEMTDTHTVKWIKSGGFTLSGDSLDLTGCDLVSSDKVTVENDGNLKVNKITAGKAVSAQYRSTLDAESIVTNSNRIYAEFGSTIRAASVKANEVSAEYGGTMEIGSVVATYVNGNGGNLNANRIEASYVDTNSGGGTVTARTVVATTELSVGGSPLKAENVEAGFIGGSDGLVVTGHAVSTNGISGGGTFGSIETSDISVSYGQVLNAGDINARGISVQYSNATINAANIVTGYIVASWGGIINVSGKVQAEEYIELTGDATFKAQCVGPTMYGFNCPSPAVCKTPAGTKPIPTCTD